MRLQTSESKLIDVYEKNEKYVIQNQNVSSPLFARVALSLFSFFFSLTNEKERRTSAYSSQRTRNFSFFSPILKSYTHTHPNAR